MLCSGVVLFSIIFSTYSAGVGAVMTKVPANMAAVVGSEVRLECESDITEASGLNWGWLLPNETLYRHIVGNCEPLAPYDVIFHTSSPTPTSCNLIISNVTRNLVGDYRCMPYGERSSASEIIVLEAEPEIPPEQWPIQRTVSTQVPLWCSVHFAPVANFTPFIAWSTDAIDVELTYTDVEDPCGATSCNSTVLALSVNPIVQTTLAADNWTYTHWSATRIFCTVGFSRLNPKPSQATNDATHRGAQAAVIQWKIASSVVQYNPKPSQATNDAMHRGAQAAVIQWKIVSTDSPIPEFYTLDAGGIVGLTIGVIVVAITVFCIVFVCVRTGKCDSRHQNEHSEHELI